MRVVFRPLLRLWRRLTAMRTALVLLFLLAVAAVPGSLLPQRPLNPDKVQSYLSSHGAWGRFLDHIGMFDVFGSVWFAAIYLLLAISLVGCLIPRIRQHARAVLRKPLPAPRHLSRLPESGRLEVADTPAGYAAAARPALGRRWRIVERTEPSGALTLSAEKGYSRETGNLIFHIALLAALILIAVGRLFSYQGTVIVTQGSGFCNTVAQYDSWKPGRFAAEGKIVPADFCVDDLTKFTATYTASNEPSQFAADITYQRSPSSPPVRTQIRVNHPLRLEGDRLYLIGHGFTPMVTITMPNGKVIKDQAVFIPRDPSTYYSEGAFKESGPSGANEDVGVQGFFAPTPVDNGGVITSAAPQANNPVLGIFVWKGDLNYTGLPQSVYSIDTSKMTKLGGANLRVGQSFIKDGVRVRFDGWLPWASLQVSHDPAQGWLLWAAAAMVGGLLFSLGVRRRRVWLRLTPSADVQDRSHTVVEVGGLARSDSGNFTTEFAALLKRLREASPPQAYQSTLQITRDDQSVGAGRTD